LLSCALAVATGPVSRPAAPSGAPPLTVVDATDAPAPVVLDLVVRDKKSALVADLRAEEVELYEDGVRQAVQDLRRVATSPGGEGASPTTGGADGGGLVVFLFPRLQGMARDLARDAALEFVKKQLTPGMAVAVLLVGPELVPIQGFTADAKILKEAIGRAVDPGPLGGDADIRSLFSLVLWLKGQSGRKTVLLFSPGLAVPSGFEDVVEDVLGLANQQRVSFYGIDPRGVELATKDYQRNPGLPEEVWLRGQSQVGEDLRGYGVSFGPSGDGPSSAALARLAQGTGGFVTERTNSFSKPMRQVAEDVGAHYELIYAPAAGSARPYRHLEVKVMREGVTVQAPAVYRVGTGKARLVPAFERRLVESLAADPLPSTLEIWDRALRFEWDGQQQATVLWVAVPLEDVTLARSPSDERFEGDVSILARVKDSSDTVAATFSQRVPLGGPLDQVAQAHTMSVPFVRRLKLAPGEYALEVAVQDGRGEKVTARRTPFRVQPPTGIAMSSLSLCDLLPEGSATDPDDPLALGGQRLVPNVGQPIQAGQGAMTLHSVVYPQKGSTEKAEIAITLLLDGQPVNRATAVLPAPDARGRIPYATAFRMDVLPPGTYRFDVAASQGSSRAEESVSFTIVR